MLQTLTVACLAIAPSAMGNSDAFLDDFDEAVTLARKENKDLFVDFTGSDWCGWCIKLKREVFSKEDSLEPVSHLKETQNKNNTNERGPL